MATTDVYIYNFEDKEVISRGMQIKNGAVLVNGEEQNIPENCTIVPVHGFYESENVSDDVVPHGSCDGRQIMVECMNCGFKTIYGVLALFEELNVSDIYPSSSNTCKNCSENVWKEIRRERAPCEWPEFGWE